MTLFKPWLGLDGLKQSLISSECHIVLQSVNSMAWELVGLGRGPECTELVIGTHLCPAQHPQLHPCIFQPLYTALPAPNTG